MALTTAAIKNAAAGDILRDEKTAGLHLRATATRKAFYLYYRTRGGRERRPKLGDWPMLGLDKAREIAKEWLEIVARGGDPSNDWAQQRKGPTIGDLCDEFLKWAQETKKPRTHKDYKYMVERHIRPRWASKKTLDIRNPDVEEFHRSLRKTPTHANRLRATLSKMFNLAEKWEMRPLNTNPAKRIDLFKEKKRRRYTSSDEAKAIHTRLKHYADENPASVAFIWLLIYTGARPSEIAAARREQRVGNRIELVDHKTDKDGRLRIIFLPPQAVAVLDKIGKTNNGTITGIKSPRRLWRNILDDTGLRKANLRMYDLRHSFASAGVTLGMSLPEIGGLLGHSSPATTQRYAHLMDELGVGRATRIADQLDTTARQEDPFS